MMFSYLESSLFALIHSFTKFVPTMYWATCKEGVVDVVNKATMAELSVLITHYLTYSIISSLRGGINSYLSYSFAKPTELLALSDTHEC